ncbi:MAG: hypothetical protein WAU78_05975 [Roseiarcus sp.]
MRYLRPEHRAPIEIELDIGRGETVAAKAARLGITPNLYMVRLSRGRDELSWAIAVLPIVHWRCRAIFLRGTIGGADPQELAPLLNQERNGRTVLRAASADFIQLDASAPPATVVRNLIEILKRYHAASESVRACRRAAVGELEAILAALGVRPALPVVCGARQPISLSGLPPSDRKQAVIAVPALGARYHEFYWSMLVGERYRSRAKALLETVGRDGWTVRRAAFDDFYSPPSTRTANLPPDGAAGRLARAEFYAAQNLPDAVGDIVTNRIYCILNKRVEWALRQPPDPWRTAAARRAAAKALELTATNFDPRSVAKAPTPTKSER